MTNWTLQDDEFCFDIRCNDEIRITSAADFFLFIQKIATREIGKDATLVLNEIANGSLFGRIRITRRDVVDAAVVGGFILMLGTAIEDLAESSKSPNFFWKQLPEIIQTDGVKSFEFESKEEKVKITRSQIVAKLRTHSDRGQETIALEQNSLAQYSTADRPIHKATGHFMRFGRGHYVFVGEDLLFNNPLIETAASRTLREGIEYRIDYYEIRNENRTQTVIERVAEN